MPLFILLLYVLEIKNLMYKISGYSRQPSCFPFTEAYIKKAHFR